LGLSAADVFGTSVADGLHPSITDVRGTTPEASSPEVLRNAPSDFIGLKLLLLESLPNQLWMRTLQLCHPFLKHVKHAAFSIHQV
jgi:hypothetical protein